MLTPWFISEDTVGEIPAATVDLFSDAVMPSTWTLTRSAAALGRGSNGRWTSYPANTIRQYYDPISLVWQGFLVESAARTQLSYRSRASTGLVGLVANNAVFSTESAVQTPFGLGVTRIIPTTASAQHGYNFNFGGQGGAVGDGTTVSFQAYFKPIGSYRRGEFFMLNRAGVYSTFTFTMEGSGSVITSVGSVTGISITPDTDGFFCLKWTMSYGAGATNPTCNLLIEPDAGTRTYAADGTSGFHVAYFGAEIGPEATSPILSDGTVTVTRPADELSSQTPFLQAGRKSIGIDYTPLGSGDQTILYSTGTDIIELRNSAASVSYSATTQSTAVASISGTAPAAGVGRTAVLVASLDEFRLAQNGQIVGTDNTGFPPSDLGIVRIGAGASGLGSGALLLRRLKYWSDNLSASAATVFSADLSTTGTAVALPVLDIQPTRTVTPTETRVTFIVTLTGTNAANGARFGWRTIDGTAKAGVDYVGDNGVVFISSGATTGSFSVDMGARSTTENLSFIVELVSPVDATLGISQCTVTLQRLVQQGPAASTQLTFGATPSTNFTLTRASAANARNASGVWTSFATNVQRHHYVAAGVSGLLIEPAAAEQRLFDSVNPTFVATESTITTDTTTQTPTGLRSIRWRKAATTLEHRIGTTLTTSNCDMPTGEFTLSLMVKPVGVQYWRLRVKGIDNVWREVRYDLSGAGAVVVADTGTINYIESDPFFAGWYRISMDRSQAATAGVSAEVDLTPVDAAGNVSTTADTAHGIDICHVQLEVGAGVSSPIIVQAAAAKTTRAADTLKATGSWFQIASYSLGMRFIRLRNEPATQTLWQARDTANATTNDNQALQVEAGSLVLRTRTGGVTRTVINGGASTVGAVSTLMMIVDAASRIAFFDSGVKRGEGATVTAPVALSVLRIGSTEPNGVNPGSILIQAIFHWNSAITDEYATLFSGNLNFSPPPGPAVLPVISIPVDVSVAEGSAAAISISKSGTGTCSVSFRSKARTATLGTDYTGVEQVVNFAENDTTVVVNIQTTADAVVDPDETFGIEISTPTNCTLGNAVGTVTIREPPRVVIPATASVEEGSPVTVTLTKTGTGACSVSVITQQVTATVNVDYTGIAATPISFGANETSKTVTIQTTTDAVADPGETFRINVSDPVGCVLGNAQCTVTITDPGTGVDPGTAYPRARGFATEINAGEGQAVYYVTTLADSGTGSLRAGCTAGNKLIVFEVGGAIRLLTELSIGPNTTIAGETAPRPGITIQSKESVVRGNNVRISHIVFERGHDPANVGNNDAIKVNPSRAGSNTHLDHCAFFWATDETVQFYPGAIDNTAIRTDLVSMSDCMFCEPLYRPSKASTGVYADHEKVADGTQTQHNYGLLIGFKCFDFDIQYCLHTECDFRVPWIDHSTRTVLANNLALNCSFGATIQMNHAFAQQGAVVCTCVGYLMISGPGGTGTSSTHSGFRFHTYSSPMPTGSAVYVSGLYGWQGANGNKVPGTTVEFVPNKGGVPSGEPPGVMKTSKPIDITGNPVSALTAQEIYDRALLNCGPRPKERANPNVARQITKLRAKAGKWVNHQTEVNGTANLGFTVFSPTTVTRSLRDGTGKFSDNTTIPLFPTTNNAANAKAWLRKFKDDISYD